MMLILVSIALAAQQSIYGGPDPDRVVADVVNTLKVVGNLETPTNIKDISEAHWVNEEITDYPYYGHRAVITQAIENETKAMRIAYAGNVAVTQDTLYRHPAGNKQFGGSDEEISKAQRVKARVVIDTSFNERQATGLYAPPGEVITIEIPETAKGKFTAVFNIQSLDFSARSGDKYVGSSRERLPMLSCRAALTQTVNKIGWPVGGVLTIETAIDSLPYPVEITVSGCILTPWFKYGVTTDDEWETVKKYPGLMAVVETGNVIIHIPSHAVRSSTRLNDGMKLLRSCAAVMEHTALNTRLFPGNVRSSGRKKFPNAWWCDSFVPYGSACAWTGYDYSSLPVGWGTGFFNMDTVVTGGAWGSLHEMGHHYQHQWGFGAVTEVTNNALVVMCYSYATEISAYRYPGNNGEIAYSPDNAKKEYLHMYSAITGQSDKFLKMYIMVMYCFGRQKQMELIMAHQKNTYYDKTKYGWGGTWLLTAGRLLGVDMRKHIEFAGYVIEGNAAFQKAAIEELDAMNLKPFYPVANLYQTGYVVNGVVEETVRPYRIVSDATHIFNFTQYSRWREGHGTFEIGDIEGRPGAWKKLAPGVYEYTPSANRTQIDEWRLPYRETTTGQTIITYGKIQQIFNRNTFERYHNISRSLGVVEAYQKTVGVAPDATGRGQGGQIARVNGVGSYVVVCKGKFLPPKTGTYKFYAAPDEYALFYISETPLTYDPSKDSQHLVLTDDKGYHGNYDTTKGGKDCPLDASKEYYFSFVIYNKNGEGGGKIGYTVDGSSRVVDLPSSNVILVNATAADHKSMKWVPEWVEIKGIDQYEKSKSQKPQIAEVTAPKEQMSRPIGNLYDGNTKDIYVSKFNPHTDAEPFPHMYTFKFLEKADIESVNLANCNPTGRPVQTDNLSIVCDGEIVDTFSYYSENQSSFALSTTVRCKTVTVMIDGNSLKWDNMPGGTCFREISFGGATFTAEKVIPISHSAFTFSGTSRTETFGAYYNSIGKYISKGGSVEILLNESYNEIVIVGDKWQNAKMNDVATVYINDKKVGEFSPDLEQPCPYGPKQYKAPLFIAKQLETQAHTKVRIEVESGEIGLAALLVPTPIPPPLPPVINPSFPVAPSENPLPASPTNNVPGENGDSNGIPDPHKGLSAGAKAGIAIAVILLIAGIVVGVVFLVMYIKSRRELDVDLQLTV